MCYRKFRVLIMMACLSATLTLQARSKKKPQSQQDFAYYMLVLSYAPDFCAQPNGDKDPRECGVGRHIGFIVHGLWPQGETTRGPENCGSSPVSQAIISDTIKYVPTESLIQHEWKAHGSCSGLDASAYFAQLRKARDLVKIPDELKGPSGQLQLTPDDIAAKLAAANPAYPKGAFRISCYPNKELQEIRICFSKDLTPRACGSSAGQCSAKTVVVRPVR